uniref:Uncharacterized protein n=1 Tax=Anopheles coluzzii TaxID=1518534 RepID=A0A8W7Q3J4_ANOCL
MSGKILLATFQFRACFGRFNFHPHNTATKRAKMNPVDHHHHHHHHHHNNLQKGHMIDDGRLLDHHTMQTGAAQMSQLYGARGSSSSSSPGGGLGHAGGGPTNPAAALLVVPQPINATKIGATGLPNGTGRKYQCKMCPQLPERFRYRVRRWLYHLINCPVLYHPSAQTFHTHIRMHVWKFVSGVQLDRNGYAMMRRYARLTHWSERT